MSMTIYYNLNLQQYGKNGENVFSSMLTLVIAFDLMNEV